MVAVSLSPPIRLAPTVGAEGNIDRIVFDRFFDAGRAGTCVEIGAARPDWLSIGHLFRESGWDVLAIEPNPAFAAMHRAAGNAILECACAAEDRDDVEFMIVDCHGAAYRGGRVTFESWSSLGLRGEYRDALGLAAVDAGTTRIRVAVRRLDTLLARHRPAWREIDLVAVDVEGWELEALAGLDFARHRPRVVVMENLFVSPAYRAFMRRRGYALWKISRPNEVYVRCDLLSRAEIWRGALSLAANRLMGVGRLGARRFKWLLKRKARRQ